MADNESKTPEDIEKELSVGKFAGQQARTLGFQLGGVAVGWLAGMGLAKTGFKNTVGKWMATYLNAGKAVTPELLAKNTEFARKTGIPAAGAVIGSMIGGIASMYEHWVKVEREQLSVQEINKDVAGLMEKRIQFEDTLAKQEALVDDMLTKQKSFAGALDAQREQAPGNETARG